MAQLSSNGGTQNLIIISDAAKQVYPDNNILKNLAITQAILEGAVLKSPPSKLALLYNNLFGIKGLGTGLVVNDKKINRILLPTHEYYPGRGMVEVDQSFAVNATLEDSFKQHRHVMELPRYKSLWAAQTFNEVAKLVRECGYATDPDYTRLLIDTYNKYIND